MVFDSKLGITITSPSSSVESMHTAPTSLSTPYSWPLKRLFAMTSCSRGFSAMRPPGSSLPGLFRTMCTAQGTGMLPSAGTSRAKSIGTLEGGGAAASSFSVSAPMTGPPPPGNSSSSSQRSWTLTEASAYQATSSSQVISRSLSASRVWNNVSIISREPSSCRILAGNPKNLATSLSFLRVLMSSRLLMLPSPLTSQMPKILPSIACWSRSKSGGLLFST
mmetsp:Transcript_85251/g.275125  ORF Transcript_85251/g.275125 Transcript_85251/m.275125 type:complete len:221 (+) Transcript_85251:143-805(+)